jgi:hypothetical protein
MPLRVVTLIVGVVAFMTSTAARDPFDWVPYVNERFGFSLRYPAHLFGPERKSDAGDGEVFAGVRGRGRLLVGALENSDGHTIGSYLNMIRQPTQATTWIMRLGVLRGLCSRVKTDATCSTKR